MAIKSIQYNQHTFDISYEIVNPHAKIDIIILHGWGSNKKIMRDNFHLAMHGFRHIYIDLPGFGSSTCSTALTTADVARIVELLLVHINVSKCIIMGHSFGGKVALLLDPKVLVLLSSAGIYRSKSVKVQTKITLFKMLKGLGLAKLRSKFVAEDAKHLSEHMYQTFKNVVDEDFSDRFSKYSGKALLCWGKDDTATPLSSGKKIESLIEDSQLVVYEGDHFFFTKNIKEISQRVEETFLSTLEH
jgi:pimeloyl-ACP methyl ester carboxylesterase